MWRFVYFSCNWNFFPKINNFFYVYLNKISSIIYTQIFIKKYCKSHVQGGGFSGCLLKSQFPVKRCDCCTIINKVDFNGGCVMVFIILLQADFSHEAWGWWWHGFPAKTFTTWRWRSSLTNTQQGKRVM